MTKKKVQPIGAKIEIIELIEIDDANAAMGFGKVKCCNFERD